MTRLLAAAALAVGLAAPASAEPTEVVCRDVRVRLLPIVYACLTVGPDAPAVTWECTLRGQYACDLGSTR